MRHLFNTLISATLCIVSVSALSKAELVKSEPAKSSNSQLKEKRGSNLENSSKGTLLTRVLNPSIDAEHKRLHFTMSIKNISKENIILKSWKHRHIPPSLTGSSAVSTVQLIRLIDGYPDADEANLYFELFSLLSPDGQIIFDSSCDTKGIPPRSNGVIKPQEKIELKCSIPIIKASKGIHNIQLRGKSNPFKCDFSVRCPASFY